MELANDSVDLCGQVTCVHGAWHRVVREGLSSAIIKAALRLVAEQSVEDVVSAGCEFPNHTKEASENHRALWS